MIFKMKKLAFVLLLMIPFCLSFCKKKPCEEKRNSVTQTVTYIETDTLGGFKGQNTITFASTCTCFSTTGLDCVNGAKGGCFGTGFSVLNLTNKKVTIRMFAAEDEARLNQTPKTVLTCQPNGVSQISDGGLSFLSNLCSADLQKLVRVSYQ
jgi:hypothetical protein